MLVPVVRDGDAGPGLAATTVPIRGGVATAFGESPGETLKDYNAEALLPSLDGLRTERSVKLQWNLHATAAVPLKDEWRATGRVDVSYTGPTYNNLLNTTRFGERTITNVRLGVENDKYTVSLG